MPYKEGQGTVVPFYFATVKATLVPQKEKKRAFHLEYKLCHVIVTECLDLLSIWCLHA